MFIIEVESVDFNSTGEFEALGVCLASTLESTNAFDLAEAILITSQLSDRNKNRFTKGNEYLLFQPRK